MSERSDPKLDQLDDYVRGLGAEDDVAAYEEDLFLRALAGDAPELVAFDSLVATMRHLAERGTLMTYVSRREADELRARYGDRMAYAEIPISTSAQRLVLPRSAELVMTRTRLDVTGVTRIDVEAVVDGVGTVKTMPDIHFDAETGDIYGCCEMELSLQLEGMPVRSRFWGHGPDGRRLLGEAFGIVEYRD